MLVGGASGFLLASSIADGWPPQTDPRLAIRSGGPRGSSGVDPGDLEPPGYEFTALWTVYEMACFFMSPGGKSLWTCSPSSSSLCRLTDSGWCLFRSSTECWTLPVCYRDRSAQRLLCRRLLRFHSCSSWPSLSCPFCATTSFGTDSAENSGIAAGAAPVVLWRHCDHTASSSSPVVRFSRDSVRQSAGHFSYAHSAVPRLLTRLFTTVAHGSTVQCNCVHQQGRRHPASEQWKCLRFRRFRCRFGSCFGLTREGLSPVRGFFEPSTMKSSSSSRAPCGAGLPGDSAPGLPIRSYSCVDIDIAGSSICVKNNNNNPATADPLDVGAGALWPSHPPFGVEVCLEVGDSTLRAALLRAAW